MDLLWIYCGSIVDLPVPVLRSTVRTSPSRLIESLRGLGVGSAATCVSSFVSSSLSFVTRSSLSTVRARMWRSVVRGWAGRAGSPVWTRALDPHADHLPRRSAGSLGGCSSRRHADDPA